MSVTSLNGSGGLSPLSGSLNRTALSSAFSSLYRLSFYAMLVFATLVLSIDAVDSKLAMLYPVMVAAAALVAFVTVDRNPALGISRSLANLLGLGSVALSVLEFKT